MAPRKRTDKNTPLYRWRIGAGLMLKEAAELFGVSLSTYRRLELLKELPKPYALAFETIRRKKR
jgi:transcriptional regulator with XRE-family HTH domain